MDRGLLLGDGVFETLRCYNGKPLALDQHLARLSKGLNALEISYSLDHRNITDIIQQLLSENNLLDKDASVRITITRGEGQRGLNPPTTCTPTLLITTSEYIHQKNKPLNLCISKYTINEHSPLSQFKTLQYLEHVMARKEAVNAGFDDAILLNTRGNIVCTTAANIFLIINDELHTPALTCGALPGITRNSILEMIASSEPCTALTSEPCTTLDSEPRTLVSDPIKTHERPITLQDFSTASEIFICNSLIEIQPVDRVDNLFSATQPPSQTLRLAQRYSKKSTFA